MDLYLFGIKNKGDPKSLEDKRYSGSTTIFDGKISAHILPSESLIHYMWGSLSLSREEYLFFWLSLSCTDESEIGLRYVLSYFLTSVSFPYNYHTFIENLLCQPLHFG